MVRYDCSESSAISASLLQDLDAGPDQVSATWITLKFRRGCTSRRKEEVTGRLVPVADANVCRRYLVYDRTGPFRPIAEWDSLELLIHVFDDFLAYVLRAVGAVIAAAKGSINMCHWRVGKIWRGVRCDRSITH